ncbi:MAG: GNAT family N-acetyltransferase [Anaerolineae bacterium]|nr:GNAT family N-acetyltransferase [Anaerolineae bacterium]
MPVLTTYHSNDEVPAEYQCQIRAFVRMLWHDVYIYDLDAPLFLPERHPKHVVVAERHALISYARVNWLNVAHAGETYRLYCLGDVFTYPAFRKKGYGQQVVEAGTALIRGDHEADVAILFCDPELETFYAQSDWQHLPALKATVGDLAHPEAYDAFAMMLFLSHKAQQHRPDFDTHTLNLPGYGW